MWIEQYRAAAERYLKQGSVGSIEFAGPTYQIEVYDPKLKESFWPFFQFTSDNKLQDAFCSCSAGEEGCAHLAAAYLKIYDGTKLPLHVRFENSFWNQLCLLFAEHIGYDAQDLIKKRAGVYVFENEVNFEITAEKGKKKNFIELLLAKREKESPENSIKFSNLSQEEITKWREGRPSPQLRYNLSFWADLAKEMFFQEKECQIQFEEDAEGLPTHVTTQFPKFSIKWSLNREQLEHLIPFLPDVSPLQIFETAEEQVNSIAYDPDQKRFFIKHKSKRKAGEDQGRTLGQWLYIPGKGFYAKDGKSLLAQDEIDTDEIPEFLDQFHEKIAEFIPVHPEPISLSYQMFFDKDWNWHFLAYLFEKGDLEKKLSTIYGQWAYIQGKGFYPIKYPLFSFAVTLLSPSKVSNFINEHRLWLSGQEGFQTHLSSIESYLSYTFSNAGFLRFYAKTTTESIDLKDFGDWVYYTDLGFFSKRHSRLGFHVRPGVEVSPWEISSFIKSNREELESIPNFFTSNLPITERGLEISVKTAHSLIVKPVYTSMRPIRFYGDFIYVEQEGFIELPLLMRIPDVYQEETVISQVELSDFLQEELPTLQKYILKMDSRLKTPVKTDLELRYLVRTASGELKTDIFLVSEHGSLSLAEIYEALEKKKHYLLSQAGLLDLRQDLFQWLKQLRLTKFPDSTNLGFSTMDFIRLDATYSLLNPPETAPFAEITRNLLKELRDFSSHEKPDLKGLASELRVYQQTGVNWLWFLYKNGLSGLLCDDMGLGKTHQAMALMAAIINQKVDNFLFLVVCPTSVIYHWQDKLNQFLPEIAIHTFHGLKRTLENLPKRGILLTSYGLARSEKELLSKIPFELAVYDEVQVAKNSKSRLHSALLHMRARMRLGLSGTPIENNLRELKSLFDIVLPGYMPGETRYRELFVTPIERDQNEEKKALLTTLIRPFVLRRRKSEVLQELPEKTENKSFCDLTSEQITLYQQTLLESRDSVLAELRDPNSPVNFVHIFSILSRLKQICNHPALVLKEPKNYQNFTSGKWDLFVELLHEALESEQKVVVFSQYLYMLDIIGIYLKDLGIEYAEIRGDTVNRREELRKFQEDPACRVFIGSLQAAGLGIDLTAASVVILYDRWWNAARENQAIDRVHRIGQKWGVQVFKLITKGTIEEKIDAMISRKGKLLDEIVAADDQSVLKKFTRAELIDLLTLDFSAESP